MMLLFCVGENVSYTKFSLNICNSFLYPSRVYDKLMHRSWEIFFPPYTLSLLFCFDSTQPCAKISTFPTADCDPSFLVLFIWHFFLVFKGPFNACQSKHFVSYKDFRNAAYFLFSKWTPPLFFLRMNYWSCVLFIRVCLRAKAIYVINVIGERKVHF